MEQSYTFDWCFERSATTQQLSVPIFFANSPRGLWSMVARNHEAMATLSQQLMQTPHPGTIANPEVLEKELSILFGAVSVHPTLKSKDDAPLFGKPYNEYRRLKTLSTQRSETSRIWIYSGRGFNFPFLIRKEYGGHY